MGWKMIRQNPNIPSHSSSIPFPITNRPVPGFTKIIRWFRIIAVGNFRYPIDFF